MYQAGIPRGNGVFTDTPYSLVPRTMLARLMLSPRRSYRYPARTQDMEVEAPWHWFISVIPNEAWDFFFFHYYYLFIFFD